jgi:hypothetical protein
MRRVTKQAIYVILAVVVVLLALGALPGFLKSGDPYYLTATPAEADWAGDANATALNASALSTSRFPFTTGALTDADGAPGRSEPYWRGPVGLKGAFTHSPFDEEEALLRQFPNATVEGRLYAAHNGTVYRLAITQSP